MKGLLAWLGLLCLLLWSPSNAAAETVYGSFVYDDTEPNALFLGYPITPSSPLDFGRAMRTHPDIVALVVFSDGGDVTGALLVAEQVHDRGLATIIPAGTGCYSACAFIFFAGSPRFAAGDLGVHQFSGGPEDMSSVQYSVAEIVDALTRFGTPPTVLADMFRTTPEDMFVYTPADAVRLGLNTDAPSSEQQAKTEPQPSPPGDHELGGIGEGPMDLGPIEFSNIFASPLSSTLLSPDAPAEIRPDAIPSPAAIYLPSSGGQTGLPKYGPIWWTSGSDEYGDATMVVELAVQLDTYTFEAKITWQKNHDETLPAESTMLASFSHVGAGPTDEVTGLPGVLAKSEAMVVGKPLVGASAMVTEGEFIFASTSDEPSSTENALLLNERYIDVAIVLKSGRNAILTLEKDDAAQAAFREILESWVE